MAESGQLGWVEREVEARQWADQVEAYPGAQDTLVYRCILVCATWTHTPCGGICWCMAGLYPGEEGGPEAKEEGYDAQEGADGQVNSIPIIHQTKSVIRSLRLFPKIFICI